MNRVEQLETALIIECATADHIQVAPARRLTGPGLIWEHSGAVIDIVAADADKLATLWEKHARQILDAIGWNAEHVTFRRFLGGISLAISAPQDQLYSAIFVAQAAWHYSAAELLSAPSRPFVDMINDLKPVMTHEADPALIALIAAAQAHDVDILCDDDEVSLGHGTGAKSWPVGDLPAPENIDWSVLHDVPLALITGTNGKTTTTRLCAAIARAAGKIAGLSSTDFVQVSGDILDRGDYSGPGGARLVLRDPRVEFAFLEVARGGILRRGLATRRARVAVVTNIAKDHLGEYGVMTLPDLTQAKFAVARALLPTGILVLNADDPHIANAALAVNNTICWFSLASDAPSIERARKLGQPCAYVRQGQMIFFDGTSETWSLGLTEVPITYSGTAKHNVQNALAALCVCIALGISHDSIRAGLSGFISDTTDNPGRMNAFSYNGARVFVDFAHNAHSISAVCNTLASVPSRRRFLMISQPGDHSDADICEVTTTAVQFKPDRIVVAEISDYLRGRILGETPDLIANAAISSGFDPGQIQHSGTPSEGAKVILDQVEPGDLVLLLVLSDRDNVFKMLAKD